MQTYIPPSAQRPRRPAWVTYALGAVAILLAVFIIWAFFIQPPPPSVYTAIKHPEQALTAQPGAHIKFSDILMKEPGGYAWREFVGGPAIILQINSKEQYIGPANFYVTVQKVSGNLVTATLDRQE